MHCIDDLLFICSKEIGNLEDWMKYLNENKLNLKFISHLDPRSVYYIHVIQVSEGSRVISRLYRKSSTGNTLFGLGWGHHHHSI